MTRFQILCFMCISLGLVACKNDLSDLREPGGKQEYQVIQVPGTVIDARQICNPMTQECSSEGTELTLEFLVGSGCESFLGMTYTLDQETQLITVEAKVLKNVTPNIACTMAIQIIHEKVLLFDQSPPFHIKYSGTLESSTILDYGDWTNNQMYN